MPRPRINPPPPRRGFTLVELTIVILMLSILAAMVIPKITQGSDESRAAAAATTVQSVQAKIMEVFAQTGEYPATIDPDWFAHNELPANPWDLSYTGARVWYDSSATGAQTHPLFKHFRGTGVYWYNPNNGRFRALVPTQATDAETLDVYNNSNGAGATDLTQITGG